MVKESLGRWVKSEQDASGDAVTRISDAHPRTLFALHETADLSCGTERVDPHSEIPWHFHADSSEVLFCTGGHGTIFLQEGTSQNASPFVPGVMACVPRGVKHRIVNDGNIDLQLVWVLSPPRKVADFRAKPANATSKL